MRAAVVTAFDGPAAIEVREVPEPVPTEHQVLIDVRYAGVGFSDLLQTRGEYQLRPEPPFIPGWEVSGVVRSDGRGWRAGDRVAGMPVVGGFAQCVAVDARMVFPLPDSMSFATGAAVPLNYLTAHLALVRRGRLTAGETVLVHGAAGGVGSATCSMAAALGARVIAVVSSAGRGAAARAAGAHDVVLADGFKNEVCRLTAGRGVDVVVDPVGGDRFTDSLRSLRPEGRLLVLGFAGGDVATVRTNRLLLTNTGVLGVATRELWDGQPDYPAVQWREIMTLLASGLRPPIMGADLALDQAGEAVRLIEERRATGKVLIRVH